MKLEEKIKVMQHFENGGIVEYRLKNTIVWCIAVHPSWDWYSYNYRIKREKVVIEKWLCRDIAGDYVTLEVSNIDKYGQYEKIKLIETYEVEI